MQLIYQNWIWIVVAIAILAFFFLQRSRGGFGGGHGHSSVGGIGGFEHGSGGFGHDGLGHHGHHGHRGQDDEDGTRRASPQPIEAVDPVSNSAIPTAGAITSVYQGKAYYFASKENRGRFEAAPQDFAGKAQAAAMTAGDDVERPRRRRHGC